MHFNIYQFFFSLHRDYEPQANKLNTSATKVGPGRKSIHTLEEFPKNDHFGRKTSRRYGKNLQRYFDQGRRKHGKRAA